MDNFKYHLGALIGDGSGEELFEYAVEHGIDRTNAGALVGLLLALYQASDEGFHEAPPVTNPLTQAVLEPLRVMKPDWTEAERLLFIIDHMTEILEGLGNGAWDVLAGIVPKN